MKKTIFSTLAICTLFTLTSNAQSLNMHLEACVKIKDNSMRLNCFDKMAEQVQLPQNIVSKKNRLSFADKLEEPKTASTTKAEKFGAEHLKKSVTKESDLEIVFIIKSLSKDQFGTWRITFENGQLWKQTDDKFLKIKVGESVLLKKGFLNAVYLKKNQPNSNKKIRVKRLK
jgi:hypothetical protein